MRILVAKEYVIDNVARHLWERTFDGRRSFASSCGLCNILQRAADVATQDYSAAVLAFAFAATAAAVALRSLGVRSSIP